MEYRRALVNWSTGVLLVLLLPLMVWISHDYGATWDEPRRHQHGIRVVEYWNGERGIRSFKTNGSHLYGGLFDILCVYAERHVNGDRYVLRHRLNATFGWIGILATTLVARRLFGASAGLLALLLLTLSPRYFGDAMNNPKDLPFAALTMVAVYQLTRLRPQWPYLTWTDAGLLGLAIALPLNVRPGALLYLGYFALTLAAFLLANRERQPYRWAETALKAALVAVLVLLLGTVCWPWAQQAPFTRPFEAMLSVAHFDWPGHVLYRGVDVAANDLPWHYVPVWFGLTTPPVVLAGLLLSFLHVRLPESRWRALGLWGMVLFPVIVAIARGSTLYTGIRHFLFIYPLVVVLAAAGWLALLDRIRKPYVALGWAVVVLGIAEPLRFDVRNHPNQYVYFNALAGGPKHAALLYEFDYWGNCLLQAAEWSAGRARDAGRRLTVAGKPQHLVLPDLARFPELQAARVEDGQHHLQLAIVIGRPARLRLFASDDDVLHRVTMADGAALCVVRRGPKYAEIAPP
jgi:hypothetical protein